MFVLCKAVTRIFFGGCHVELERHRREDRGAEGSGVWGGDVPSSENFCIFYFKMASFCARLDGFMFGIFTVPSYTTGSLQNMIEMQ